MDTVNKDQLRERLINEGYIPEFGLDNTIDNLLGLQKLENPGAFNMLLDWLKTGKINKFDPIEGIDLKFLRNNLKMKDPAIILAYGMLLYDPKPNAVFLKRQEKRKKAFTPPKSE